MNTNRHVIFFLLIIAAMILGSCSKSESPTAPSLTAPEMPISDANLSGGREIVAVYEATIDPAAKTFTIAPTERMGAFHFPLNQYYPNVLQIASFNFGPPFTANIKLKHPYPGSGIKGYDPRVIAVLPARAGVSMNYPTLGVTANDKVVLKPDGYTRLFDKTSMTGNTNPFMAYFKSQPFREWASTGVTEDTKTWTLDLSGFGGSMTYNLVVDVSTHFPSAPQPVVDNAPEPVQIRTALAPGLVPGGGSASISVYLLDWQGNTTIGSVKIEAPSLFNGVVSLTYQGPGQNADEYVYGGMLTNSLGAPEGKFNYLVGAWDQTTLTPIYQEFTDWVEYCPEDPQDITPLWLNGNCKNTWVDSSEIYAYVAAGFGGLKIYDVTDKMHPVYLKTVAMTNAYGLCFQGGYIFVTDIGQGLQIVDVNYPPSASIVKTVPLAGNILGVCVQGDYAYIANGDSGLQIIDINPIGSANLVKTLDTPGYPNDLDVYGEYVYFGDGTAGLQIIDVVPPESASIVKTVNTPHTAGGVDYNNGYAYVADWDSMEIIDVEPVGSASIVRSVTTAGDSVGVHVVGSFAYVSDFQSDKGLNIIDINPPESAYIVNKIAMPGSANTAFVQNGYAWVSEYNIGLEIVDVDPPYSASIINTLPLLGHLDKICIYGNYAFAAGGLSNGIFLLDISTPSSVKIIKYINLPNYPNDMVIQGDYGYVVTGNRFCILDINPPESTNVIKSIDTTGVYSSVDVYGEYAYVGDINSQNMQIIDIEPPASASVVKTVPTAQNTYDVAYSNGYVYVADQNGLDIIDVEPIDAASIVKNVPMSNARGVTVVDNYAHVSCIYSGYKVVDIKYPQNASIIKTLAADYPYSSFIQGGYAYVADYMNFKIFDIYPLEEAYIIAEMRPPQFPIFVTVDNGIAYVGNDYYDGLRILDLW